MNKLRLFLVAMMMYYIVVVVLVSKFFVVPLMKGAALVFLIGAGLLLTSKMRKKWLGGTA
ncbi:hypothetical protein [Lysinibacillus piscis]|uniref:Uncharacterized protein n=1 Tax=Lysinibacillus piscis TaxID=2518931 RepID=A0ABQ5NLD5_9BACI|nr:hypothetical protein [Lysinibacillus sp. KH24]GLC88849.1 hypothetical protein LYSBPC_19760 [Lysinibacillus sp. KH24]